MKNNQPGELLIAILVLSLLIGVAKFYTFDVYAFFGGLIASLVGAFIYRFRIESKRISFLEKRLEEIEGTIGRPK